MSKEVRAKTGQQIRRRNPDAPRSDEWAIATGRTQYRGRPHYVVQWPNGDGDLWPVVDPTADYQVRDAKPTGSPAPTPTPQQGMFARVDAAAYETARDRTAVIIYLPGKHELQRGELVTIAAQGGKS